MDKPEQHMAPPGKMKVEIWSDVLCPFCYIGKREFERALAQFPDRDQVQVVWRSFELDPNAPARSAHDMYGMLVEKYGGTRADAKARVDGVVQRARTVGLDYRMDKAIIGSSFDAHRLLQLAKTKDLGDAMKERLFKAYFSEGAHLADTPTLIRLGSEVGLDGGEVEKLPGRLTEEVASIPMFSDKRLVWVRGIGAGTGIALRSLGSLGGTGATGMRPVAETRDDAEGAAQRQLGRVPHEPCARGGGVDADLPHARHLLQAALDQPAAGCAAHALDEHGAGAQSVLVRRADGIEHFRPIEGQPRQLGCRDRVAVTGAARRHGAEAVVIGQPAVADQLRHGLAAGAADSVAVLIDLDEPGLGAAQGLAAMKAAGACHEASARRCWRQHQLALPFEFAGQPPAAVARVELQVPASFQWLE